MLIIMPSFLPSEISRLIYGYLKTECNEDLANEFLRSCDAMKECLREKICGRQIPCKVQNFTLLDILNKYSILSSLIFENAPTNDSNHHSILNVLQSLLNSKLDSLNNLHLRDGRPQPDLTENKSQITSPVSRIDYKDEATWGSLQERCESSRIVKLSPESVIKSSSVKILPTVPNVVTQSVSNVQCTEGIEEVSKSQSDSSILENSSLDCMKPDRMKVPSKFSRDNSLLSNVSGAKSDDNQVTPVNISPRIYPQINTDKISPTNLGQEALSLGTPSKLKFESFNKTSIKNIKSAGKTRTSPVSSNYKVIGPNNYKGESSDSKEATPGHISRNLKEFWSPVRIPGSPEFKISNKASSPSTRNKTDKTDIRSPSNSRNVTPSDESKSLDNVIPSSNVNLSGHGSEVLNGDVSNHLESISSRDHGNRTCKNLKSNIVDSRISGNPENKTSKKSFADITPSKVSNFRSPNVKPVAKEVTLKSTPIKPLPQCLASKSKPWDYSLRQALAENAEETKLEENKGSTRKRTRKHKDDEVCDENTNEKKMKIERLRPAMVCKKRMKLEEAKKIAVASRDRRKDKTSDGVKRVTNFKEIERTEEKSKTKIPDTFNKMNKSIMKPEKTELDVLSPSKSTFKTEQIISNEQEDEDYPPLKLSLSKEFLFFDKKCIIGIL